jgi:uncharacterized protein YdaU (DUF1376 family)
MRLAVIPNPIFIMSKDPAFLFYPNDYLGGTMGMTFEEKGAYLELLMLQFNRGHMTTHMIGHTVGQLWVKIQDKFIQDAEGLWYNERLDLEKERRKTFTESRRNNVLGKNQHTKNKETEVGHMTTHMIGHMENVNIDVNKRDLLLNNIKEYKELLGESYDEFIDYWCEPNKNGKLRYELEKFFDVKRRVNTWIKNKLRYGNSKTFSTGTTSESRMAALKEWVHS